MWKPLLAAAGGAVVGFLIAKSRYEKEAYAYANERIEQAKVYAEERADRTIKKLQAEAEVETLEAVAAVFEKDTSKMAQLVETNTAIADLVTNYQGFSSSPTPLVEAEEDSESHIVLIRRKEFFEGPPSDAYNQVSVTYFGKDDILYDELGQKQLDVRAAIGSIRPDWFGHEADDENVCYVRNSKIEVEFEVIRSMGSFANDVLGLGQED